MFRRLVLALFVVAAVPSVGTAEPVWPGSPTGTVRRHVDEMIGIATNASLSAAARHEAARVEVARTFDFSELSRRALGEHWSRMTRAQREEMTAGLRALVTAAYASRTGHRLTERRAIAEQGGIAARVAVLRKRVTYLAESVSGGLADVTMNLTYAGKDLPVDVALVRRGREWRIADFGVDGVRLTDNLRAQVAHLSRGTDYGEVLERLRAREQSTIAPPTAISSGPSQ